MLLDRCAFSECISVLELESCAWVWRSCGVRVSSVSPLCCGDTEAAHTSVETGRVVSVMEVDRRQICTLSLPLSLSVPPSLRIFSSIITSLHCPPMTQMLIATLGRWPSRQPMRAPPSITHRCLKRYWVIRAAYSNRMPQCWGGLWSQAESINITALPPKRHRLP